MESYEFEKAVEETRERLRDRLPEYLHSLGLPTKVGEHFICLNPEHNDKHPSMALLPGKRKVFCYSRCDNKAHDIFDLVGWEYGIADSWGKFKKTCELFHEQIPGQNDWLTSYKPAKPKEQQKPKEQPKQEEKRTETKMAEQQKQGKDYGWLFEQASKNRDKAIAYLESRGIDGSLAEAFNIGLFEGYRDNIGKYTDESKRIWQALVLPCTDKQGVIRNTAPTQELEDPKGHRYRKLGSSALFAKSQIAEAVEEERPLFICEGELDCLSVISVGGKAISPGSADNIKLVTEAMQERIDKKEKLPLLILAFDNDTTGKNKESELLKQLQGMGCPCYGGLDIYGDCKDANEALQKDKDGFMETVLQLQSEDDIIRYIVQKESVAGYLNDFIKRINESADKTPASTGLPLLDSKLDGGLYEEGLYILGAMPGTGKTSLALQMADHMAETGRDVLFFALEMSKFELVAKSVSRFTYLLARDKGDNVDLDYYIKSTRGVMAGHLWKTYDDEQKKHIRDSITAYGEKVGSYVKVYEAEHGMTTKQITELVEKRIQATKRLPVIFIDYLQILQPTEKGTDIRVSMNNAISDLKSLAKNNKLPIFLISSLNRPSYEAMTGMGGFKETSNIEYTCDCGMVLNYDTQWEEDGNGGKKKVDLEDLQYQEPRKLVLRIVKDRNGMSGAKLCYDFYSRFNYFTESEAQPYEEKRKRMQSRRVIRQEAKEEQADFKRRLAENK